MCLCELCVLFVCVRCFFLQGLSFEAKPEMQKKKAPFPKKKTTYTQSIMSLRVRQNVKTNCTNRKKKITNSKKKKKKSHTKCDTMCTVTQCDTLSLSLNCQWVQISKMDKTSKYLPLKMQMKQ